MSACCECVGEVRVFEGRRYVCWFVASDGRIFAKTVATPVHYGEFTAQQWEALPLAIEVATC